MSGKQQERQILAACIQEREYYYELSQYIDDSDFTDQGLVLYKLVEAYYDADPNAPFVDHDLLVSRIRREHPKHADRFIEVLESFEPVSFPNLKDEVIQFKLHTVRIKLSSELLNGDPERIENLMEQYRQLEAGAVLSDESNEDSELFYQTDLTQYIEEHQDKVDRVALYPGALNDNVNGGAFLGQHVVVFACPEVGKTLFSINLAAGMLDAGHKVMYYSNEETAYSLMVRFLARMTDHTMRWVEEHVQDAQKKARRAGYDNMILKGASPGSPEEICALIERYDPEVVFVDQVRLLHVKGQEIGSVSHIEMAHNTMRTIGKKYGVLMVSVTQAGESASNKLVLEQTDVYMSNTGVPGSADLMIGLGMDQDFEYNNRRMINLPKNKISGLHRYFPVQVDPLKNKVTNV